MCAPKRIGRGKQTIEIITDAGLTVCLWQGEHLYEVGQTDEGGKFLLEIDVARRESILLTVSGPGVNAVAKTILVR